MSKEVNIHIKAKDADETKRKIQEVGQATESAGRQVEKGGESAEKTASKMNTLGSAVSSLKGWLTGLISIHGLFAFFERWLELLRNIGEAQQKVVESTKSLNDAAKSYAGQVNILGTEGGIDKAKQQILDIQAAGNITDFKLAEAVAISTHSAYGTTGELLAGDNLDIAKTVGGLAQRRNLSAGGTDNLLKLLAGMGVKTQTEAQLRIQQLLTVQQQSKIKNFEEFLKGGTSSIMGAMAFGSTPEMAMAQFASAMDVEITSALGSSKTKQINAMLLKPSVAKEVGKLAGLSAEQFSDLPQDQKLQLFGQWVSAYGGTGAGQKYMMEKGGLSPTELGVAKTLQEKQGERIQFFHGLAGGATAAQFQSEEIGYRKSVLGRQEEIRSQASREGATASDAEVIGQELLDQAQTRVEKLTSQGKEPGTGLFGFFGLNESEKRQLVARWALYERLGQLKKEAKVTDAKAEEFEQDTSDYSKILGEMASSDSPGGSQMLPSELGAADIKLKALEKNVVNNYYFTEHRDVNYFRESTPARPRVDTTETP